MIELYLLRGGLGLPTLCFSRFFAAPASSRGSRAVSSLVEVGLLSPAPEFRVVAFSSGPSGNSGCMDVS